MNPCAPPTSGSPSSTGEPILPAKKPGFGLLAVVAWMVVNFFLPIFPIQLILTIKAVVNKDVPPDPGLVMVMGLGVLFLTNLGIVAAVFLGDTLRLLAVRGIRPIHVLLVLALVPPLMIVNIQMAEWFRQIILHRPRLPWLEEYQRLEELPVALMLFAGCVLPAVGEEIFFRGFLGRGLVGRYGVWLGVGLTSVLFGATHYDSWEHTLTAALFGAAAHAVYLTARTLWAPVLLHVCYNGIVFGYSRWIKTFTLNTRAEFESFPAALNVTAAAAIVALGVLLYQTRTRWILPDGNVWSPGYHTVEMPPASTAAYPQVGKPRWRAIIAGVGACAGFGWALSVSMR